jgi:hypothetical protein
MNVSYSDPGKALKAGDYPGINRVAPDHSQDWAARPGPGKNVSAPDPSKELIAKPGPGMNNIGLTPDILPD